MFNLIGKIIITFSVFSLLFNIPAAIAYQSSVHRKITEHAVLKSQRIQSALEAAGILPHDGDLKDFGIRDWSYSDWIQRGANWEDGIQIVWGEPQDIAFCHFFNPVTDQGYTLLSSTAIGQSLIARSHDVTNEWSYVWLRFSQRRTFGYAKNMDSDCYINIGFGDGRLHHHPKVWTVLWQGRGR